ANRDSYFFVDLPVDEPDPVKRLRAINRETHERKLDDDAEVLYRLGAHPFVAHWAMSPRVFTFNVSNVRGPAREIYVLGARVREMYSLAEIAPRHALRVAIISASGTLFFGLCADRDAVRDLDLLADGIKRALEELLAVVVSHVALEPAHDHHGFPAVLAPGQVRGRGGLVGHRDPRRV